MAEAAMTEAAMGEDADTVHPQPRERRARLLFGLLAIAALALTTIGAVGPGAEQDPVAALKEGNRLFRNGQLEEAVAAYRSGYSTAMPHPTLAYNLGTTLHHLDRLPEAVLWYRRGGDSGDPWLEENLWLARRSLGSQTLPAAGLLGHLSGHTWWLEMLAVAIGWLSFLGLLLVPRLPWWSLLSAALLASFLYAGAFALHRWGPAPAVLLQDCSTPAGDLPAGTEVWVQRAGDAWRLAGSGDSFCPIDHAELVIPRS